MWSLLFFVVTASTLAELEGKYYRSEFEVAVKKFGAHNHLKSESKLAHKNRYKAFCKFAKKVEKINRNKDTTYLAVNNFMSILTEEERKSYLGLNITGYEVSRDSLTLMALQADDAGDMELQVASSKDNSKKISDVKDQGGCGSCWTFAATAALEGEIYFTTGEAKVSLSEQEYMECSTDRDGCQGGWMEDCYKYSIENDRIAPTSAYRYNEIDSRQCNARGKANALTQTNTRLTGNVNIKGDSQLLKFAEKHVVSVAIEVADSFMVYGGGVYNEEDCMNQVNHAVAVVGYGKQGNSKYWKVRNSWGKVWGDQGYILMSRDINNQCFISTYSHIPEVECRDNNCEAPNDGDDSDDGGDDTDSDCVDLYDDCPAWASYDYCTDGEYIDFMKSYCQKSCKLCGDDDGDGDNDDGDDDEDDDGGDNDGGDDEDGDEGGDDTDSDCVDQYDDCPTWASYDFCTDGEYIDFMKSHCQKSCELCGDDDDGGDDDDDGDDDDGDDDDRDDDDRDDDDDNGDDDDDDADDDDDNDGDDDEGDDDDGDHDDDGDEDNTNFCPKKVYLGKCHKKELDAREQCEKAGLSGIECVILKSKKCWFASSGKDSGSNYVEMLQKC